jgi:REP element-mobilizing transposase RayT
LTTIFAIDTCAYAVMSNHYHLIVHVDRTRAQQLAKQEVVHRWEQLFSVPPLVERWCNGQSSEAERETAEAIIERWRQRLYDVSWFMKCLNEHLARRANAEDNCTGRFWEGRFKSQALLDEAGLLTAMAYVDLNPIRAGSAATPEESKFTSIYQRISKLRQAGEQDDPVTASVPLLPFQSPGAAKSIPYRLDDYLQLVHWTGQVIRDDKRGAIDDAVPPIVERLSIDAQAWRRAMRPRGNVFGRAMGRIDHMRLHARALGQSWVRGLHQAKRMYGG